MSDTNTLQRPLRELASREGDGLAVSLLWSKTDSRVVVVVHDWHADERLEFDVDPANALDAFEHPYVYAARLGVEYRVPGRATTLVD